MSPGISHHHDRILGMDPNSGISGLFRAKPETGRAMSQFANVLLHGDSALTAAEKEFIATYVSFRNGCLYCTMSHRAVTAQINNGNYDEVDAGLKSPQTLTPRMRALVEIAMHVRSQVAPLPEELRDAARAAGGTDDQIHDTVLVAAAFSMFNRYVETLNPLHAGEKNHFFDAAESLGHDCFQRFDAMGKRLATSGYV